MNPAALATLTEQSARPEDTPSNVSQRAAAVGTPVDTPTPVNQSAEVASFIMTRRGIRGMTGSSNSSNNPPSPAALHAVAIELGRAHAELVAARLETEHFRSLLKKAKTSYGFWQRKALNKDKDAAAEAAEATRQPPLPPTQNAHPPVSRSDRAEAEIFPNIDTAANATGATPTDTDSAPVSADVDDTNTSNSAHARGNQDDPPPPDDGDDVADDGEDAAQGASGCERKCAGNTMRRQRSKKIADSLAALEDKSCGDILARMLERKGMPNFWQAALKSKTETAKAAAENVKAEENAGKSGDEAGDETSSTQQQQSKKHFEQGEQELAVSKRSAISSRILKQLARFADSVCSDILARIVQRLGRLFAVCCRFARGVLDESRAHILECGYSSLNWAK
eukprot:1131993-Pleurochrysis_carterae.AAC.1